MPACCAQGGPQYTPRMVLLDLSGSLGAAPPPAASVAGASCRTVCMWDRPFLYIICHRPEASDSGLAAGTSAAAEAQAGGPPAVLDTWEGRHEVHRAERIARSAFVEQLDLESDAPFEGGRFSKFVGADCNRADWRVDWRLPLTSGGRRTHQRGV